MSEPEVDDRMVLEGDAAPSDHTAEEVGENGEEQLPPEEELKTFPISVKLPCGSFVKIAVRTRAWMKGQGGKMGSKLQEISDREAVQDIVQFLFDMREMACVTNFELLKDSKPINQFGQVADLELSEEGNDFEVRNLPYDEYNAEFHVRRLMALVREGGSLRAAPVCDILGSPQKDPSYRDVLEGQDGGEPGLAGADQGDSSTSAVGQKDPSQQAQKEQQQQQQARTQVQKKGRNKKKKPKKKAGKTNKQGGSRAVVKGGKSSPHVFDVTREALVPDSSDVRCYRALEIMPSRPTPCRRVNGDLFYIRVDTLERDTFYLTACAAGFYVNRSSVGDIDGAAADPLRHETFTSLCENYYSKHPFEVLTTFNQFNGPWLETGINTPIDESGRFSEDALQGQLRDWNDEYQTLTHSAGTPLDVTQRYMDQLQRTFLSCAVEGAMAIVNKQIVPLNPECAPTQHVFAYKNIFFCSAYDTRGDVEGEFAEDMMYKANNNDLWGAQHYASLGVEGLHTVLQCLVSYRGYRYISQALIPGILQAHTRHLKYGSIDQGETIECDEEFHELWKQAATMMSLKEHYLYDAAGEKVKTVAPYFAKGVLGSDGRKYFVDLHCITCRDYNFVVENSQVHGAAIIRPELVEWIRKIKQRSEAEKKKEEEAAAKAEEDAEADTSTTEEGAKVVNDKPDEAAGADEGAKDDSGEAAAAGDKSAEAAGASPAASQVDGSKSADTSKTKPDGPVRPFLEAIEQVCAKDIALNPNMFFSGVKVASEAEELEADTATIKLVGNFLRHVAIPALISDVSTLQCPTQDSAQLCSALHARGINYRYLGIIAQQLPLESPTRNLFVSELVNRCAKHILNAGLRSSSEWEVLSTIENFMNAYLGTHADPKKKQRQRKANTPLQARLRELSGRSSAPTWTSESLWKQIREQAKVRFLFDLEKDAPRFKIDPLSAMRALCRMTGVKMRPREYAFDTPSPVCTDDVVGLFPLSKGLPFDNMHAQLMVHEGKQLLQMGNVQLALQCIVDAAQLVYATRGPMNPQYASVASVLANTYLVIGDANQAALNLMRAVLIYERTTGYDTAEVSKGYTVLGQILEAQGEKQKALACIQRAVKLNRLIQGENCFEDVNNYMCLGQILQKEGNHKGALPHFLEGLRIAELHYPAGSIALANLYHLVAQAYSMVDDFRNALQFERRNYLILNGKLGEEHPNTKVANIWLKQFTGKAVQLQIDTKRAEEQAEQQERERQNSAAEAINQLPVSELVKYITNPELQLPGMGIDTSSRTPERVSARSVPSEPSRGQRAGGGDGSGVLRGTRGGVGRFGRGGRRW